MIFSKRSAEGYLLIDHTASPGVTQDEARALGVPFVAAGQRGEFKTLTCKHCGTSVAANPQRTRQRGHCFKCDHYLCDICAAIGDCRPIAALADAVAGSDKPLNPSSPLILRS